MFKRALQVRVVKSTKDGEPKTEIDKAEIYDSVAEAAGKIVKKVAFAALAYVVVDTARQVAVARAMKQ